MSIALSRIVEAIESQTGKTARKTGLAYRLPCPSHGGTNFNLMLSDGDQKVLAHCYSQQCDPKDILESVGLKISDIYHKPLNKRERKEYRKQVNTRQVLRDMQLELCCLSSWATSKLSGDVLRDSDKLRVKQAFIRLNILFNHFEGEL